VQEVRVVGNPGGLDGNGGAAGRQIARQRWATPSLGLALPKSSWGEEVVPTDRGADYTPVAKGSALRLRVFGGAAPTLQ
jgi:hypothetical protein